MKNKLMFAAIAITATLSAAPAMAATIIPAVVGASGSYSGYGQGFAVDLGGATTDWAAASTGANSYLDLDLGAQYFLSGFSLVDRVTSGGGNGGFVGGTTDFTTSFSLAYYTDASFGTQIGSAFIFNKSTPSSPTNAASFAYSDNLSGGKVQFVRYQVLSANGANPGLSNISFAGSVPESSTWAMMLIGFGLMGVGLRYRRKATTVAYA